MAKKAKAEEKENLVPIVDGEAKRETDPEFWDKDGKRYFRYKNQIYCVRTPGLEEQRQADWEYSRTFMAAIKSGLPTMKELEKLISDRNIIDMDFDKKEAKLQAELANIVRMINDTEIGEEEKKQLNDRFAQVRDELVRIRSDKQSLLQNTAEGKADEARISFLTFKCTEYADGENKGKMVWTSLEDFRAEQDLTLVWNALFHYMSHVASVTQG